MFKPDGMVTARLPEGLFVVANESEIERLRATPFARQLAASALVPLPANAALPADLMSQARVLVLEVDPADNASMRRMSEASQARPDLPIIAAVAEVNVSLVRALVRQGVVDVVGLPFGPDELTAQALEAAAALTANGPDVSLAPMITVVRGCGGSGATSVLTHLAAALASSGDPANRACLIDLDLQAGNVCSYLGKTPDATVRSLLDAGPRLDAEFLRGALTDSGRGFSIVAAPQEITPLESVDTDQLLRIINLLRREFAYVLVDLPADWTNWGLSIAASSNDVLLVTDLSIAGLRQAKRRVELFASVGIDHERVKVLVNRVERRLFRTIGVDEVRDALNCEVIATLAAEAAALSAAQDEGALITEVSHRSKFGSDIRALAVKLVNPDS